MINDKLKPVDNTRIIDIQGVLSSSCMFACIIANNSCTESSDEGLIYFLTCRIPKPTSDETATTAKSEESCLFITYGANCLEHSYAFLQFSKQNINISKCMSLH